MSTTPRLAPLFDSLLTEKGSDLHLSAGYPPLGRVRGELKPLRETILTESELELLLVELLSAEQRRQLTEELDLDFSYSYGAKARFRANYFHKVTGLAAVFRPLPGKVPTLTELGAPDAVRKLAERRSGLVLVTGSRGSGKTTTLAAMLHHINSTRQAHILTIEQPVEFVHEPLKSQVTQREVGPDTSSFATALRSAGRENADVLLVGDLHDAESLRLALELASSGVLVLGTVQAPNAAATIERLLHAFPAEEQAQVRGLLAESLAGIVSQHMLRTADGKGRVVAQEVLVGGGSIAAMIREGQLSQLPNALQAGQAQGLQTVDMHLEKLVAAGTVKPEAAMERAQDREAFAKTLQRLKPGFEPPEDAKA
jgi:twitching motility protein PilT